MNYLKVIVATAALSALAMSCTDTEYFDKEEYDKLVAKTFPVTDVDPDQDWQTVATANVSVKLMQSDEGNSTVRIYDDDPSSDDAHMLAKASLASGETMYANINYLLASPYVYITVTNPRGFTGIYPRTIENYALYTTVGDAQSSASAAPRRADEAGEAGEVGKVVYHFADEYNGGVYPTSVPDGAASFSDEDWSGGNIYKANDFIYFPEGNYTLSREVNSWNSLTTLVLLRGANVTISCATTFGSNSRIVVCEGATITTEKNLTFTNGAEIYNAGTIKSYVVNVEKGAVVYNHGIWETTANSSGGNSGQNADINIDASSSEKRKSSQFINTDMVYLNGSLTLGGAFLNVGSFVADHVNIKFTNEDTDYNAWVNEGYFEAKTFFQIDKGKSSNQIINNCHLYVSGTDIKDHGIRLKENTIFNNNAGAYVNVKARIETNSCKIIMKEKSIIKCANEMKIKATTIEGPEHGRDFSLIVAGTFNGENEGQPTLKGKLKIACTTWTNMQNSGWNGGYAPLTGQDIYIAPSNCSAGYTGTATSEYPERPASWRYCYEDMFPSPGDYDFNDVVLDITPEKVADNKVKYSICLVAVGATKQLAGALRLKGISASQISSVEKSSSYFDYGKTTTANTDMFRKQTSSGEASSSYFSSDVLDEGLDGNAVIYLFNDAHYSMYGANDDNALATNGSVKRMMINTVASGDKTYQDYDDYIASPTTYTVTVTFTEANASTNVETARTTACLDPFLIESYNGVNWEVHEVSKKTDAVLFSYGSTTNENYSNNYPWCICVPGTFKYPIEGTPIGSYSSNVLRGAYQTAGHSFGEWARYRYQATDWYKYPTSSLVYE